MTIKLSQYCRRTIYRTIWLFPVDYVGIYLHAESRAEACRKLTILSSCLLSDEIGVVDDSSVHSCDELLDAGVSEDPDLRIFEMSHHGREVTQWVESPLFLSIDQSLIGKWVSLNFARALSSAVAITR